MKPRRLLLLALLICAACSKHKKDSQQGDNPQATPVQSLVDAVTKLDPPPKFVSKATTDAWDARGFWHTVQGCDSNGLPEERPHYMKTDDLTGVITGFRPKQEAFGAMNDDKLKTLPDVEGAFALNLNSTRVTDAGMKELARHKYLSILDLGGTAVGDAGLKELTGLKYLAHLNLGGNKAVTDAGVKSIASIRSITSLKLGGTKITEAALKDLVAMPNLNVLYLDGAKLTDRGVKELAGFKSLTVLSLYRTGVTDTQANELQQALPKCKIILRI